jgi:hypothetical protein
LKRLSLSYWPFLLLLVLIGGYFGLFKSEAPHGKRSQVGTEAGKPPGTAQPSAEYDAIQYAYNNRLSDLQVQVSGHVERVLSDDLEGSRHQRFILRMETGHTLLVAHNIDLAPRIEGLTVGDPVTLFGEYEWNERGGVIHWTHRDPAGRHQDGWVRHRGRLYP